MNLIREILDSDIKPKEKVLKLAKKAEEDSRLLGSLVDYSRECSIADKGNCIEAMEYVSKEKPELVLPYIDYIIETLDSDAPKAKWESSRVIGNLAAKYPDKARRAIDNLIANTKDKGTVVRWSTAFALTEIAKNSKDEREKLITLFREILKSEENNGVRNVYLKAMKKMGYN